MQLNKIPSYNISMGLNRVPTKRTYYLKNSFIENDIIKLKEHTILISKNYPEGKLSSTLFYVKDKYNNWVKSKLKYFENGVQKIIRSENNVYKLDRKKDC